MDPRFAESTLIVFAEMTLAPDMLPDEPVVIMLPALILPVAVMFPTRRVFAEITFAPVMLPGAPVVTMFPANTFPVTDRFPVEASQYNLVDVAFAV